MRSTLERWDHFVLLVLRTVFCSLCCSVKRLSTIHRDDGHRTEILTREIAENYVMRTTSSNDETEGRSGRSRLSHNGKARAMMPQFDVLLVSFLISVYRCSAADFSKRQLEPSQKKQ